jgi:hypothetical protein
MLRALGTERFTATGLTEYGARGFEERKYGSSMKVVSMIVGMNKYERQKSLLANLRSAGIDVLGEIDFRQST